MDWKGFNILNINLAIIISLKDYLIENFMISLVSFLKNRRLSFDHILDTLYCIGFVKNYYIIRRLISIKLF